MSGFIEEGQFPPLAAVMDLFRQAWASILLEGGQSVNLFIKSREVMIQDPQDIRMFLLPIKWQGVMVDQLDAAGAAILEAVPTAARLAANPLVVSAQYSMSMPGAELMPHIDNVEWIGDVYRCHLGLSCPPGCGLVVAGEERQWADGEVLVFDSARVEHSAYNRSDRARLILIVDIDRNKLKG